jgi:hypothetical protein
MKALSIRQPWAWAILHAGKDVENRDWQPRNPGLHFRGEFLIHASGNMTRSEYEDFIAFAHDVSLRIPFPPGHTVPLFGDLQRGGIVGKARVIDVVTQHQSPWFFGPMGLVLADVRPLPFVPLKGALGFFDVPDALVEAHP